MVFDQAYYDSIWDSVHRHDYCPYWRDRLTEGDTPVTTIGAPVAAAVSAANRLRILDVGTGCGHLVKLLRAAGCDAWGLEVSDYAIANSCAPGYVVKGSVTNIPFKDDSFDIVFSNGLWEYVSEEDVPKGRDEIWRVGAKQIHQIDHSGTDFRDDFVTWKPQAWWDEQLAAPKVLVSCPTHESKEYAHQEWVDMAKSIDYPNYEVFVVDNSPTDECAKRWGFDWLGNYDPSLLSHALDGDAVALRIAASMKIARQKFLKENFQWWFNVEIDVIPDPRMLKSLLRVSADVDWVAHCYPARGLTELNCSGMGCSLWSRRLIESFSFEGSGSHLHQGVDAYFWNWVRPQSHKFPTIEFWGRHPIKHLKQPE